MRRREFIAGLGSAAAWPLALWTAIAADADVDVTPAPEAEPAIPSDE
jgi:hypothetical protein